MIRRIENIHILFWLLKDISWCLAYKPLALVMIIPTLIIGILVTYFHRKKTSDLIHNSAVVCWILANSTWMVTEFLGVEHDLYNTGVPGKWIAAVFFILGIAVLVCYYSYRLYKWAAAKKQLSPLQDQKLEKV